MPRSVDHSKSIVHSFSRVGVILAVLGGSQQLIAHSVDFEQHFDGVLSKAVVTTPMQPLGAPKPCQQPAVVYLDVPDGVIAEDLLLEIESNFGIQLTFLPAGLSVSSAAGIIFADCQNIYVTAFASLANPHRAEILTTDTGELRFVRVRQVLPGKPVIYAQAVDGEAMLEHVDFGCFDGAPCFEFATAHIDVDPVIVNGGNGAIAFEMFSDQGSAAFAFLSGTSTASIVGAINTLAEESGIVAKYDSAGGVTLRSAFPSSDAYLSVQQLNGQVPLLQVAPGSGELSFEVYDEGSDDYPGDTNHDDVIDVDDLLNVVADWGKCEPSQSCDGDVNRDEQVNVDDLLEVINNWGPGECP